jgi:hypothetical protein
LICSPLDKDFQELKSRFGYDYIELQLDFSMDLYPFFPPLVKVIRPRLQGSMMLRVTTMEILKLSYWNPARDMKSVLVNPLILTSVLFVSLMGVETRLKEREKKTCHLLAKLGCSKTPFV